MKQLQPVDKHSTAANVPAETPNVVAGSYFTRLFKCCPCVQPPQVNDDVGHIQRSETRMTTAMRNWLANQTLERKLEIHLPRVFTSSHRLFKEVKADLKAKLHHRIQEEAQALLPEAELIRDLTTYYKKFENMSPFLGIRQRPIGQMEFTLKLNEEIRIDKNEELGRDVSGNHLATREKHFQKVKTLIDWQDLFKSRRVKPDAPVKEVKKVVLLGEAGTGKTSLTKKLAYEWSQGNWCKEFAAVYVLPVRALREDKYDNKGNCRTESTLATAIANECFTSRREEKKFRALRERVADMLRHPTTLVILDGLDEQHGMSQAILEEAKEGNHKLLATSRPYGLPETTRASWGDIEVDNIGLDEKQRDKFINYAFENQANPNLAADLIVFIKVQNLQEMANVPVNLQILCSVWEDEKDVLSKPGVSIGLSDLYRRLVGRVWKRFKTEARDPATGQKHIRTDRDSAKQESNLFEDLEKVALDSLQQGKLIISCNGITKILGRDPSHLLADAGFLLLQKLDQEYQFPHLTFQEYFTGRCLARQFLSGDQKAVIKFLRKHIYIPRYRRTLSFMSGEIVKGIPNEVGSTISGEETMPIQTLLNLVAELPEEILGLQYLILQLRLLNEWLLVTEDSDDKGATMLAIESQFSLKENLLKWFKTGLNQYNDYEKSTQVLCSIFMTLLSEATGVAMHYNSALLPLILNILKDIHSDSCRAALEVLRTLLEQGAAVKETLSHVLNSLKDKDTYVRISALKASGILLEQGAGAQEMLPHILNSLKDKDTYVRRSALQVSGSLLEQGTAVKEILPYILDSLKDRDTYVRWAALKTLEVIRTSYSNRLNISLATSRSAANSECLSDLSSSESQAHSIAIVFDEVVKSPRLSMLDQGDGVQEMLPHILNSLKNNDADVRKVALKALPTLVEQGSGAQEVLPHILNTLEDSDFNVRWTARQTLSSLLEQSADVREREILPLVLNSLEDNNTAVRSAALQIIQTVLDQGTDSQKLLPSILNILKYGGSYGCIAVLEFIPTLIEKGTDAEQLLPSIPEILKSRDDSDVRRVALEVLRVLVEKGVNVQEVLIPILNTCKDGDRNVRWAALKALWTLAEKGIDVKKLSCHILDSLKDTDSVVRSVARRALPTLVEKGIGMQEMLDHIFKFEFPEGSDPHVRAAISQALEILVKYGADVHVLSPHIVNALKHSNSDVRSAALKALSTLVEKGADVEAMVTHILNALEDTDSNIRRVALEALQTLVEKGADVKEKVTHILKALKDTDSDVRRVALEALQTLVEKGVDVQILLPYILNSLRDNYYGACWAARKGLEKVSPESLINYYWDKKDERTIPFLVPKLYAVTLTIEDAKNSDQQKLVLRSTKGDIVETWEKSKGELESFKRLVRTTSPYFSE